MTPTPTFQRIKFRTAVLVSALAAVTALSACAPIVVGGAMIGGTLMATDRRTSGAQVEDQAIELKSLNRIRDALGDRGHVSTTSYNRVVLITGEVQTEADKAAAEAAVQRVENVKNIVNELEVMGGTSLTSRSNDAILTSKVKASFVDAKDILANSFKVVTERGTVFLMGRVTEREATRAVEIARGVSGVTKVVRLFEILTEQELADLAPKALAK
ncbi:MAG: BON domain-containing protein [Burkholderiales bacterium]|jgi:osmotically-inducible protein OsmY|nr:BON domain-containing protein [Burkholderiales bacterium]